MNLSLEVRNFGVAIGAVLFLTLSGLLHADEPKAKVIHISAKKFEFTPNVLELKKGEPVVLELTTEDRKHGFKIKELGIDVQIKPGETTRVALTPDKVGEYNFHCSVFCGSHHEDMIGKIIVKN
jgi:cytochrome c oxidase subunit II